MVMIRSIASAGTVYVDGGYPGVDRHRYAVMGTVFSFAFGSAPDRRVLRAIEDELDRIDRVFSPFREDSETNRLARSVSSAPRSADMSAVLTLCDSAAALTDGWFDAFHSGRLDPTGLVKGWAVQRVERMLTDAGSTRHAINGGGDVLVVSDPGVDEPWRIGVSGGRGLVATVQAHNLAVATSGNVERPAEIVDPFTGQPTVSVQALTILGPEIVVADVLATAAVARGAADPGWFRRLPGYRVLAQDSWSSAACSELR
jgi:thiamine biosynthesis lipoprotein